MNLSPAQKKVIERPTNAEKIIASWPKWKRDSIEGKFIGISNLPKGQQLYEDMKKK